MKEVGDWATPKAQREHEDGKDWISKLMNLGAAEGLPTEGRKCGTADGKGGGLGR